CGLSETMASFVPTSRLSNVDFPAFGRPTKDTSPDFIRKCISPQRAPSTQGASYRPCGSGLRLRVLRVLRGGDCRNPHFLDPPTFGVEDLNVEIVDVEPLPDGGDAAEVREQVAAHG